MQKKNNYILFFIFLLCIVVFFLYRNSKPNENTLKKTQPSVSAMTVSKYNLETMLKSIGTAVSNESVDITSTVSQKVVSIHFSDCEYVKKGQLLVQLNIEKKIAEKKQAEINLLEQRRELNRLESLRKKKIVSGKEYDVQSTKLLDAQAKLDGINVEIKESSIVAPFDGILGIRKVSVGALLTPGSVVTTIDDIDKLKVDFTLPEKYSMLLKPNLKIVAKSVALKGKKFEGDILAIDPRVSTISRSIGVRGIIDNKDHLIKPGMMLKISIKLKNRETICIPEKSLFSIGEKRYVFMLTDNGRIKRRYVTTGERDNGFVEIEKGLNVGDKIITDGGNKLSDDDSVNVVKDETEEFSQIINKSAVAENEEKE
ncbi:MAG: efflux RND transporter periplasmic adaptor subunit [Holosporaceae bacterium]|jgi:membrane fusion protein (multidrug efflux system)|nr:efflux RND transporter periplasmic adaptor subunit [Holosporaceae bacterium]